MVGGLSTPEMSLQKHTTLCLPVPVTHSLPKCALGPASVLARWSILGPNNHKKAGLESECYTHSDTRSSLDWKMWFENRAAYGLWAIFTRHVPAQPARSRSENVGDAGGRSKNESRWGLRRTLHSLGHPKRGCCS
jgi:hypothetical protein